MVFWPRVATIWSCKSSGEWCLSFWGERMIRLFSRALFCLMLLGLASTIHAQNTNFIPEELTASEWDKVNEAIQCLLKYDSIRYAGLPAFLGEKGEGGQIMRLKKKKGAYTWTDHLQPVSAGDYIWLGEDILTLPKEMLAGVLAHEWFHVTTCVDNARLGSPKDKHKRLKFKEGEGIEIELFYLQVYIQQLKLYLYADPTNVAYIILLAMAEGRYYKLYGWLKILCYNAEPENKEPPPPIAGCSEVVKVKNTAPKRKSEYYMEREQNTAYLRINHEVLEQSYTETAYPLPFGNPQDIIALDDAQLPGGGLGLLLSGTNLSGSMGYLMGMEVNETHVLGEVFLLPLPQISPVDMVYDPLSGNIYVLDADSGSIYLVEDLDRDGVPEHIRSQPFADPDQFPFLSQMNMMMTSEEDGGGLRLSQFISNDFFPLNDLQYVLYDTNGDAQADLYATSYYREVMHFPPFFPSHCPSGQRQLEVHGAWGMEVIVQNVHTGEILAQGTVNTEDPRRGLFSYATLNLQRRLWEGEVIEVYTPLRNNLGKTPHRITVGESPPKHLRNGQLPSE